MESVGQFRSKFLPKMPLATCQRNEPFDSCTYKLTITFRNEGSHKLGCQLVKRFIITNLGKL